MQVRITFTEVDHKVIEAAALLNGMSFPKYVSTVAAEQAANDTINALQASKAKE